MIYFINKEKKISFSLVQDNNIQNYITSKSEKKIIESKMNSNSLLDVDVFLYGNLKKTKGKKKNKSKKINIIF